MLPFKPKGRAGADHSEPSDPGVGRGVEAEGPQVAVSELNAKVQGISISYVKGHACLSRQMRMQLQGKRAKVIKLANVYNISFWRQCWGLLSMLAVFLSPAIIYTVIGCSCFTHCDHYRLHISTVILRTCT